MNFRLSESQQLLVNNARNFGHQIRGAIGDCEEHALHLLHKRIQAAGLDFGGASQPFETGAQAIGLARVSGAGRISFLRRAEPSGCRASSLV